jgi:transposase
MLLKTILNRIHHFKGFVYATVSYDTDFGAGRIVVDITPRKNSRGRCSRCQKKSPGYDHLPERMFGFVPLWNIPVLLRYRPRRVECAEHGVIVESLPWADGKNTLCDCFRVFLAQWARLLSWKQVAERFRVSWDSVFDSIKHVVDYGLEHRSLEDIRAIGVDEIATEKGHKFATVVYQIDSWCRRLLWIGEERKARTLLRFFHEFGKERTEKITVVCSDMWKPYLKVIAEKAANAINILDRFHIMKMFNDALDKVRREETAQLLRDGYEPVLKNTRWLIAKRPENLTDKQRPRLKELLEYNLKSVKAYLLREEFQQFWEYVSPAWAMKFLDNWINTTMRSRIGPMKKVAKTLRRHRELILNWFLTDRQFSSGIVEAINASAKMTIRTAHGFRRFETLKYALFHRLGELPLPETTHKFF